MRNIPDLLKPCFILESGICQYGWKYHNGNCYYFSGRYTTLDYHNARTACNRMSAKLVSIRNAAENEFVREKWKGEIILFIHSDKKYILKLHMEKGHEVDNKYL